jgi:hypothetical protein
MNYQEITEVKAFSESCAADVCTQRVAVRIVKMGQRGVCGRTLQYGRWLELRVNEAQSAEHLAFFPK